MKRYLISARRLSKRISYPFEVSAELVGVKLSREEVHACVKEVGDNITVTNICVIGGTTILERSNQDVEEFKRIANKIAIRVYNRFKIQKERMQS